LYGNILISCSVGPACAERLVDFENDDGTIKKVKISDSLLTLAPLAIAKTFHLKNILFPVLIGYSVSAPDRRYARNCKRLRDLLQLFINERRTGKTKYGELPDLISILTTSDLYKNDDEHIIDDIITVFTAGMRTT